MNQPLGSPELNRDCHCISVDRSALDEALRSMLDRAGLPGAQIELPGTLLAESPVFLSEGHLRAMSEVVRAVEAVTRTRAYRETVLARAPEQARFDHGPRGVLTSYDFHIDHTGPRLIEINTNAGGVLLNHYLASAQRACCPEVAAAMSAHPDLAGSESALLEMFRREWRAQRPSQPLRTIAIVDADPASQHLYPEFLLFQSLFTRHGLETVIADSTQLEIQRGRLFAADTPVDLVYNRLTDFYLTEPGSAALLEAYRNGLAVVTPSPHVYALYADKRNLSLLSDRKRLCELGVEPSFVETLSRSVPPTTPVSLQNAEQLWAERKRYFFKPTTGYASRGAYRGAKLTRRVWRDIVAGNYVAQRLVVPTERQLLIDGEPSTLKMDFRCVAYEGRVQQVSARLYQGQTTNLRTPGGGLATVFAIAEEQRAA